MEATLLKDIEDIVSQLPFTLQSEDIPPEILKEWLVTEFHAEEFVSGIPSTSITIMTPSSVVSLFEYFRLFLTLNIKDKRFFSGMITDIAFLGIEIVSPQVASVTSAIESFEGLSEVCLYKLTIKPKLNLLTRRTKCQIFQEAPLDEILTEIFTANGLTPKKDFLIEIPGLKPIPYSVFL